jgi:hypothetical protein
MRSGNPSAMVGKFGGRRRRALKSLAGSALWLAAGCGSAPPGPSSSLVGASQGQIAAGAAVTAIAAGALWAAGGGCRLQGCPYGSYCNQQTGFCDVRKCSEGCPDGTICNEGLGRCQATPPPKVPNDFLPQDDKRQLPPGTN